MQCLTCTLPTSHSCALPYCLPAIPTSLSRWFLAVLGDNKPFAVENAQFFIKGIFSLSGLIDVIVFRLTRRGLLLFKSPHVNPPNDDVPLVMNQANPAGDHQVCRSHRRRFFIIGGYTLPSPGLHLTTLQFQVWWPPGLLSTHLTRRGSTFVRSPYTD